MTPEEIKDLSLQALDDLQGIDISSIDVSSLTPLADYMIICTGRSTRHVKALAEGVAQKARENKLKFVRSEGDPSNEWILVDLGDVVIHLMLATTREFYALEDLWEPVTALRSHHSS